MNSSILEHSSPVNVEKKKRRHLGRKPLLVGSTPAEQARIEKRRYDCKMNQRRHRARKKRIAAELKARTRVTNEMTLHERGARDTKEMTLNKSGNSNTQCERVKLLFDIFQQGLCTYHGLLRDSQISFLKSFCHPNVKFNGGEGINKIIHFYDSLALAFGKISFNNLDILNTECANGCVCVKQQLTLNLVRESMSVLYPRLCDQSVFESPITIDVVTVIEFNEHHQATNIVIQMDLISAWTDRMNGNVLKAANILRDSCFLNNGEIQQHALDSLANKALVEAKSPLLMLPCLRELNNDSERQTYSFKLRINYVLN